jgi:hypothetical protein
VNIKSYTPSVPIAFQNKNKIKIKINITYSTDFVYKLLVCICAYRKWKVPPERIHVATMISLFVNNKICYINIFLNLIIFEFIRVFHDMSIRLVNILSQKSVLNLVLTKT